MTDELDLIDRAMHMAAGHERAARAGLKIPRPDRGGPQLKLGEYSDTARMIRDLCIVITSWRVQSRGWIETLETAAGRLDNAADVLEAIDVLMDQVDRMGQLP